jgi:poly-gamma-glutamate synthase PgsB/CapB
MVPFSIYAVFILLVFIFVIYRLEKAGHQKRLRSIPVRVWVNGTRGKSSVTRLIAAGLRAGKKTVIAKTTGTCPRFIISHDSEQPINRLGMPNISEQVKMIKKAFSFDPDAVVLECMALRPDLQITESKQIVDPTVSVITNVRPDHLDVMGPSVPDIARTFISAVPDGRSVFTSERSVFQTHQDLIRKKKLTLHTVNADSVEDVTIERFSYIEHKENIALALEVCAHLGVERATALEGMLRSKPDPGALRNYRVRGAGKDISLVYAMAANDPESTYRIWQHTPKDHPQINLLVNCRDDRVDRSFQIADLIEDRLRGIDTYIITGSGTEVLLKRIKKYVPAENIIDLGGKTVGEAAQRIMDSVMNNCLIFAIGNTVGYGEALIDTLLKGKERHAD